MAKMPYILIVDDDPEDLEMLAEKLRTPQNRVQVHGVSDGQQAFSLLEACTVDNLPTVLITDYQMPILNGAELLRLLQLDHRYNDMAKLVLSTSGNAAHMEECIRDGAHKYFIKPDELRKLDSIVECILDLFLDRTMRAAGLFV